MQAASLQPGDTFVLKDAQPYLQGVQFTCLETPLGQCVVARNDFTSPIFIERVQEVEICR